MSKSRKISPRTVNISITLITFVVMGAMCWQAYASGDKKLSPPSVVMDTVKKIFPNSTITEVETETVNVTIYDIDVVLNGEKKAVKVSANGEILAVEKTIAFKELPKAVAEAIAKEVGNDTIKELEYTEIRAAIAVKPLAKSQIIYEVEYDKAGKEMKDNFNVEGKLLRNDFNDDEQDD